MPSNYELRQWKGGSVKRITWVFLGWLVLLTTAHAASFDCTKATNAAEKMICGDSELSKLDERLAATYKQALKHAEESYAGEAGYVKQALVPQEKEAVTEEQKRWLKDVRDTCQDKECIEAVYQSRINELLEAMGKEVPDTPPSQRYEVVTGTQFRLCNDLARNFSQFPDKPSMSCERRFQPDFPRLRQPTWKELSADDSFALGMKLSKRLLSYVGWADYEKKMKTADSLFRSEADTGKLKAWEAHFDIARSGENVRVVKVTRSRCNPEDNLGSFEPVVNVLTEHGLELDKRYESLLANYGDILLYDNQAYLHTWSRDPGARGRIPPPKNRHYGYVLVYEINWAEARFGAPTGAAYVGDLVCQIGYKRLTGP